MMTVWDFNPCGFGDTWTGKMMSYAAKEWVRLGSQLDLCSLQGFRGMIV
jgi:hypothetical protein